MKQVYLCRGHSSHSCHGSSLFTISIRLHLTQVVSRYFPDKAVEDADTLPVRGTRPGNFSALRQYLFTDLDTVDEGVQYISIQRFYIGIPFGEVKEQSIGAAYLLCRCLALQQLLTAHGQFLDLPAELFDHFLLNVITEPPAILSR